MSRRHPVCIVLDGDAFIFDPSSRAALEDISPWAPTYMLTSVAVEPLSGVDIRHRRSESLSRDVLRTVGLRPFVLVTGELTDSDARVFDRCTVPHLVIEKGIRERLSPHHLALIGNFVSRQA